MHLPIDYLVLSLPNFLGETISNPLFFLYLGPQTVLPLASIIAALAGVVLMFWRLIWRFIKKIFNFFKRKPALESEIKLEPNEPSIDPEDETHS